MFFFYSSDGAIYNIDPTTVKVKRRIQLANISRLSASLLSDNFFVVHVPLEYDYLFVSGRKTEIITVLRQAFTEATSQELSIAMQNMYDIVVILCSIVSMADLHVVSLGRHSECLDSGINTAGQILIARF